MERTSGNVPYMCGVCLITFSHHEDLTQHTKMHTRLNPCVKLGRKLPINVERRHPRIKSYEVTQRRPDDISEGNEKQKVPSMESQQHVNSTNSQTDTMETRHMSDMHSVDTPVSADRDSESAKHTSDMHRVDTPASADRDSESAIYFCNGCGEMFDCKQHLNKHVEGHHKAYTCRLCSSSFTGIYFLQHHMAVHGESDKPFVCGICGRKFSRKGMLLQHLLVCNAQARENLQQDVNLDSSHPQTSKRDANLSQESREFHPPAVAVDTTTAGDIYRVIQVKVEDNVCAHESYGDEIIAGSVADKLEATEVSSSGRPAEPDELPPSSEEENEYLPGDTVIPSSIEDIAQHVAAATYSDSNQKSSVDVFHQSSEASSMLHDHWTLMSDPDNRPNSKNPSQAPLCLSQDIGTTYTPQHQQSDPITEVQSSPTKLGSINSSTPCQPSLSKVCHEPLDTTGDSQQQLQYSNQYSTDNGCGPREVDHLNILRKNISCPEDETRGDPAENVGCDQRKRVVQGYEIQDRFEKDNRHNEIVLQTADSMFYACEMSPSSSTETDAAASVDSTEPHVESTYDDIVKPSNPARKSRCHSKNLVCMMCHRVFPNEYLLSRHMRMHSSETPYNCSLCPKKFKWESSLKAHLISHKRKQTPKELTKGKQKTPGRTILCNICGKISATQASHTKHMRLHTNDKPYICQLCPKRFMWHSSMQAHSRSHTRGRTRIISNQKGEAQHRADGMANATNTLVVEQQSPSANKLVTKDEAASGDTLRVPLPAQEAAEALPQKSDQDLAAKSDLSAVEGRKFKTKAGPGCEQQVTLPSETKSGLVSQGYQCNFCDKVSMTKHQHRRHVRRHTADFPYSCKLCPKKFKWHSSLSAHSKSHATGKRSKMTTKVPASPQKGFKCHICNKVSRDSSRHRRHMRLHTGDTPYSCHLCPKKFKWCSSLAAHFKSHENERLRGQVHEGHELTAGGMTVKGKETSDGINCDDEDGLQNIPSDGDAPYRALSDEKGMSKAGQHEEDSDMIGSRDMTSVSSPDSDDISQHPVCDICLKLCLSKRKLEEHMESHDEPFAFSCDMCGRRFKWLHFLEVHKRSHMRDRGDEEKN